MGLRRYLTPSNWYSDQVEILLTRKPGKLETVRLKPNHSVSEVTDENVSDTQRFEDKAYTQIYKDMISHGDIGYFGYIDGRCVCRVWGRVRPSEQLYYGKDLGLDKDGIYVHYVETAEDARRQGIGRECLSRLVERCQFRPMYVMIEMENRASMALHKEVGFYEEAILHVKRRHMNEIAAIHWISRNEE